MAEECSKDFTYLYVIGCLEEYGNKFLFSSQYNERGMAQGKEKRFDKLLFARHLNRHLCASLNISRSLSIHIGWFSFVLKKDKAGGLNISLV